MPFFPNLSFLYFGQESCGCRWMGLFLGSPVYSIGLFVYFYVNTKLFLLLWFRNVIWNEVLWYLLHYCFCSRLLLVFLGLLWFQNLKIVKFSVFFFLFSSSVKNITGILRGLHESIDCPQWCGHFHNINCANLWAWEILSSHTVFFTFIFQCFIVFIVEVFNFLGYVYS
jgi:hypothetical protein